MSATSTHPRRFLTVATLVLAACLGGCATTTPVTPAPISPDELPKLQAALVGIGSCEVTSRQKPGGDVSSAKGIHWSFDAAGNWHWRLVTPLGTVKNDYTYKLDGRNVESNGTFKNARVDAYDDKTLKVFLYDITETYICTKE